MESTKHTDVLIIGAGPSGLMMAAQLLRYGIQPTIIDAKEGPDREPRAALLYARALELFRQLQLADKLLAQGQSYYAVQLLGKRGPLGTLDFSQMPSTDIVFPFVQRTGQDSIEKLLLDRLTEKACPVVWKADLESLSQDDNGAVATIVHNDKHEVWRCGWIVGADGVSSTVQALLNIPLQGDGHVQHLFAADVEIERADCRKMRLFLRDTIPLAIVPLCTTDRYRIIGSLSHGHNDPLCYAMVKPHVDAALGFDLQVKRCLAINRFSYRRQKAEQFNQQRCFLIGDAARGISPVVGRAMNEGLLDAANLAWKLAGVINGRMAPHVLHTYQQERWPAVPAADDSFGIKEMNWVWPNWLKNLCRAQLVRRVSTHPLRLRRVFDRMAGLSVRYRRSSLAVHHALGTQIHAGDRLPCLPVFDEKTKTHTDLHRWCEKPGFILLILGTTSQHHLQIIGQWMHQKYPRDMHLYYLPYSSRNQQVFEAFELKSTGSKIVLIRPDMYIGYINDILNVSLVDTYMEKVFGWRFFGHLPDEGAPALYQ